MTVTRFRWVPVAMVVLFLAACGGSKSTKPIDTPRAGIEDRGISTDEMSEIDAGANSQGLGGEDTYSATVLGNPDDPNSPLSVRVIYFDLDSSNVRSDFSATIEAHAAYLAANSDVSIRLEGHADERGSREYNLALGERRALAVRKRLVLLGASAAQVRAVSYGEERPVSGGSDENSYALNRRVEITY
jgi:peptidoglycan-associated lipoprotein